MSTHAMLLLATLLASPLCSRAQNAPLAAGQGKFIGNIHSPSQIEGFERYWNKVTPENAGKWGEVEAVRGVMDWRALDAAHAFAKKHGFTGTPVLVRADGAVLEGYRPRAALIAWLKGDAP